jgi:hypothetical protein
MPYHPLKTLFAIAKDDLFLLTVLNSVHAFDYLRAASPVLLGDTRSLSSIYMNPFPIPEVGNKEKLILENLAQHCLKKNGCDCSAEEAEINAIVAKLYGLQTF